MSAEGNVPRNHRPIFACPKSRVVESVLGRAWKKYQEYARALYYNPHKPTGFSSLNEVTAALPKKNKSEVRAWL